MESIVVFVTASNEDEAAKISRSLVEAGLAGCVNIVGNVRSIYRWQGKIEDEAEAEATGPVSMKLGRRHEALLEVFDRMQARLQQYQGSQRATPANC